MIQKFQTSCIPERWLNPLVGHPPALWYSDMPQVSTTRSIPTAETRVPRQNRRRRLIRLIACSRATCSAAG